MRRALGKDVEMKLLCTCPSCGEKTWIEAVDADYQKYLDGMCIKDAMPYLDAFAREVLISGLCYRCQERIFNKPAPDNTASWGKSLGECLCCGMEVWEKDGGVCPCCGTRIGEEGD